MSAITESYIEIMNLVYSYPERIDAGDESSGTAAVRYYMTVFQRTAKFPLQPVWANRYEDRFVRDNGRWCYAHRMGFAHLPGDTREHLLSSPPQAD